MRKNNQQKLFICRTYIMARNAREALSKFRKQEPHECWVDEDWKKNTGGSTRLESAIGFEY